MGSNHIFGMEFFFLKSLSWFGEMAELFVVMKLKQCRKLWEQQVQESEVID